MEYGLHESLPLYAGGLGILAGDHLKAASDLGLPFVGVGICWQRGYTRQRLDGYGRQQDAFARLPVHDTPLKEIQLRTGRPLRVEVPIAGDSVLVRAWRVRVGRIPLILLDTNLPENTARHRRMLDVLYSGDRETRFQQQILLGIGGWRVLRALDVPVAACHLNEGHAGFLSLERIAERMKRSRDTFAGALRYVRDTTVFTTHTPVPAGNEVFDPTLVDRYFAGYARQFGLTPEEFRGLGRVRPSDSREAFGMTPLALRTSRYANGVSALHGQVARRMWKGLYPRKRLSEVPIGHVTNGIHLRTWLHPRMGEFFDEVLGPGWEEDQDRASLWKRLADCDDERLWSLRVELKHALIAFCRDRLRAQLQRSRVAGMAVSDARMALDPDALTIGFARRFASYKRATLVFTDPARLARILNAVKRPVQIIFAGKAHPADESGKDLVQSVVGFSRQRRFRRRVVFIEDYDMEVARHMVAGVDVWLNTPQRPREASGTSGMKAALHGALNVSILDGWWPEACDGMNGWAIGRGQNHDGTRAADLRDAADLYRVLEKQVVPLYYRRTRGGLPVDWIAHMKRAMMTIPPVFNSQRQVKEYLRRYYVPAMRTRRPAASGRHAGR
jgi:starch phosphorylase